MGIDIELAPIKLNLASDCATRRDKLEITSYQLVIHLPFKLECIGALDYVHSVSHLHVLALVGLVAHVPRQTWGNNES